MLVIFHPNDECTIIYAVNLQEGIMMSKFSIKQLLH